MRGAVWNYVGKLFENCRFTIFLNEIATPKTSEQVPKFWARNDRVPSLRVRCVRHCATPSLRVRQQKIATNDKLSGGCGNPNQHHKNETQPASFVLTANGIGTDCHTQNFGTSSEILGSQ